MAFPTNQTSITINISTDTTKNDSVASFGFRNISMVLLKCSSLCNTCSGSQADNCSMCVANTSNLFGSLNCQCIVQDNQASDYSCEPINQQTSDNGCIEMNTNFWNQATLNYICNYNSSTETHTLTLSYMPYYANMSNCLTLKLFPLTNPNSLITPTFTQDFNSQKNNFTFSFQTAAMQNQFLCEINNDASYIIYSCNFTIEAYYLDEELTYSYFVYEFQFMKNTSNSVALFATPILIKVIDCCCGNAQASPVGICSDSSVFQSQAFICTDQFCTNFYQTTNITFNYLQPIYLAQQIMNQSLVNLYTLSVTNLILCCNGLCASLPFNSTQIPGEVKIQSQISLTGTCYITIQSSITSYVQQRLRQLIFLKLNSKNNEKKRMLQTSLAGEGLEIQSKVNLIINNTLYEDPETSKPAVNITTVSDSKKIAAIVGGVVGGVLIISLCIFCKKYVKLKISKFFHHDYAPPTITST